MNKKECIEWCKFNKKQAYKTILDVLETSDNMGLYITEPSKLGGNKILYLGFRGVRGKVGYIEECSDGYVLVYATMKNFEVDVHAKTVSESFVKNYLKRGVQYGIV